MCLYKAAHECNRLIFSGFAFVVQYGMQAKQRKKEKKKS